MVLNLPEVGAEGQLAASSESTADRETKALSTLTKKTNLKTAEWLGKL
jgi:hypothetical protein